MKLAVAALAVTMAISVANAQTSYTPGAGIAGSVHDFSSASWNTARADEICAVCHIPHVEGRTAAQLAPGGLIWGRSLSTATYTLYTSASLDNNISQPSGTSKLCLGCHDGSVALEHFSGVTTGSTLIPANRKVPGLPTSGAGTDFSNTHPVSVVYDSTIDPMLFPKTNTWKGSTLISDVLEFDGTVDRVQCKTCHDVHNKDVEAPSAGTAFLLRIAVKNAATPSKLCLTCHDK